MKLAEARRQRELLSAKAQRGELLAPTRIGFAELAQQWLEGFEALVASGERAERTLEHYRYHGAGHSASPPASGAAQAAQARLALLGGGRLRLLHRARDAARLPQCRAARPA